MRKPSQLPAWFWALVSVALHAALVLLLVRQVPARALSDAAPPVWIEAVAPAPKPAPVPEPVAPKPEPVPKQEPPAPKRARASRPVTAPVEVTQPSGPVVPDQPVLGIAPGEGTLAVAATGEGTSGGGAQGGDGDGDGNGSGGEGTGAGEGEPERKPGPAQLALWMDPPQLVSMALVRPATALLMAVPGYTDMLRGSGIKPLSDLQRLHIRVSGLARERLTLAGVHASGEKPLHDAAEHVAAMRSQQPVWRGDEQLRATSWVDGSGVDRGLAMHASAFVIAERGALPGLLGKDGSGANVVALSQLRARVMLRLAIEDAGRYLPGVERCALQAVRLTVAESGGGYRLTLNADYRTPTAASQATACLRGLDTQTTQLPGLLGWLARAEVAAGSYSTKLNLGVTSDDIQRLFDELAWALRSAGRA